MCVKEFIFCPYIKQVSYDESLKYQIQQCDFSKEPDLMVC